MYLLWKINQDGDWSSVRVVVPVLSVCRNMLCPKHQVSLRYVLLHVSISLLCLYHFILKTTPHNSTYWLCKIYWSIFAFKGIPTTYVSFYSSFSFESSGHNNISLSSFKFDGFCMISASVCTAFIVLTWHFKSTIVKREFDGTSMTPSTGIFKINID